MSNKKPVPGYIWLLAGLVIGLFASFLVFLDKQPAQQVSFTDAIKQELKNAREQQKQQADKHTSDDIQQASGEAKEKPRFEFYTILSELEVFVPEPEATPSKAEPQNQARLPATNSNTKQYLLQAGSFKSSEDAERLKASLALLGVQSSIQNVTINQDSWHRVRIGPFSNPALLRETLSTLKQNNIHAMTMELK